MANDLKASENINPSSLEGGFARLLDSCFRESLPLGEKDLSLVMSDDGAVSLACALETVTELSFVMERFSTFPFWWRGAGC